MAEGARDQADKEYASHLRLVARSMDGDGEESSSGSIGMLAVGQFARGRARLRNGQVNELRIGRLTNEELRIERVQGKP
jgi:hypothetical protein